ncbi:MAG: hypothetical protein JXR70_12630 [Spirochaetales bacterium]|nr:hypothetical protein [Spirochaetales bacterium]
MSKYFLFTITLFLIFLLSCVSIGASEKGMMTNSSSLLIENNSSYDILHIYILNANGDYEELEYTAQGNIILSWDSAELELTPGEYYILAEYEIDGEYYGEEQYLAMVPGKHYGWEISEALWSDYQYGASYDYLGYGDYGYLDYAYLAYGDYAYLSD